MKKRLLVAAATAVVGLSTIGGLGIASAETSSSTTSNDPMHHYFRERKEQFDETIEGFIKLIRIKPEYEKALIDTVIKLRDKRIAESQRDQKVVSLKVGELKMQAEMVAEKIKFLSSEVTLKYLEEDLMRIESQINNLKTVHTEYVTQNEHDKTAVIEASKKLIERPDLLILHQADPVKQANFFGLLFDKVPKYCDLVAALDDQTLVIGLNELFVLRRS